jgi:hypothetical protein
MTRNARRLRPGARVGTREVAAIDGDLVFVPDPERLVHLQLRRFAGCPVCSLHLRSIVRRHGEIEAAGIREVVVFHSRAEELRRYVAGMPFAVIADPDKALYGELGAEAGTRAILDPRAWLTILVAIFASVWQVLRGRQPSPPLDPEGGRWGLPAELLIDRDGRVLACKYGEHVDDAWTVDELLEHAGVARARATELATHPR